jgi:hypothetical protein
MSDLPLQERKNALNQEIQPNTTACMIRHGAGAPFFREKNLPAAEKERRDHRCRVNLYGERGARSGSNSW